MLLKLLKHEFKVNRMTYMTLYLVLLLLAVLLRTGGFENMGNNAVSGLLLILYFTMIAVVYIFWFVTVILSFNKSMFKNQGYLTMTLPVTTNMKILSKIIMAAFWALLTSIAIFLSLTILIPDFLYGLGVLGEYIDLLNFSGSLTLLFILGIVSVFQNIIFVYLCVTFAHTKYVKGHRGLIGIGFYFVVSYIISFIQALFIDNRIVGMSDLVIYGGNIETFSELREVTSIINDEISGVFIVSMLVSIVLGVIYYLVMKYLLEQKIELD